MLGNMILEEYEVLKPRIKLLIAEINIKKEPPLRSEDLAKEFGVTKQYFSQITNGHVILKMDKAYELVRILNKHGLKCSVNDLYQYEENAK